MIRRIPIERLCDGLGIDPIRDEVQVVDGASLPHLLDRHPFGSGLFPFTPLRPMLIANLTTPAEIAAAATLLSPLFDIDHPLSVMRSEGLAITEATIGTLANIPDAAAILIPASDPLAAGADPRAFHQIIARLRDVNGCPWDRKQTHQSLRDSFVDEVYEVVDAIDSDDPANLAEELGDLFLLIVMHAQIATESGAFTIEEVYRDVASKIVRRHPHVFADAAVNGHDDLLRVWNDAKSKERAERPDKGGTKASDGEPHSMPALTRATRVLSKHPSVAPRWGEHGSHGERLLDLLSEIVANGDDPETILRAALTRHVEQQSDPAFTPKR